MPEAKATPEAQATRPAAVFEPYVPPQAPAAEESSRSSGVPGESQSRSSGDPAPGSQSSGVAGSSGDPAPGSRSSGVAGVPESRSARAEQLERLSRMKASAFYISMPAMNWSIPLTTVEERLFELQLQGQRGPFPASAGMNYDVLAAGWNMAEKNTSSRGRRTRLPA